MSILNVFKPAASQAASQTSQAQTQAQAQTPAQAQTQAQAQPQPQAQTQAQAQAQTQAQTQSADPSKTPENPLDSYKKLLDNAAQPTEEPSFTLDPKVVGEVSKKIDFTRGLPPDLLQKATSGDSTALLEVIKRVGQNSYRAALEHTTALTDAHLKQRQTYDSKRVEQGVAKKLTENALAAVPNYAHPVVKAELNRIAEQIAASNPEASPQEVAKAAQKYLADLYAALNPPQSPDTATAVGMPVDWADYLSGHDFGR